MDEIPKATEPRRHESTVRVRSDRKKGSKSGKKPWYQSRSFKKGLDSASTYAAISLGIGVLLMALYVWRVKGSQH